ncbi:hypothetical protein ACOMHN_032190 [Nucella lapillus]
MECRELVARSGGSSAGRKDEEDSVEMHEDADFTDLPVHFQPMEADTHRGPSRTPISEFVVGKNHRGLMDSSTQYLDTRIGLATPNYTTPPPPDYITPPPPVTYASSSSSRYASPPPPPPSNYTSPPPPPPPNTMDIRYNPLNRPSVYSAPDLGSHGEALPYGTSYHGLGHGHNAAVNSSGMYASSGLDGHYNASDSSTLAGPSGKGSSHHPVSGDTYPSADAHPAANTDGASGRGGGDFGLYGRNGNRLCSAGVNTVEAGFGLNGQQVSTENRQVSTERNRGGQGLGGGEQQAARCAGGGGGGGDGGGDQAPKPFHCPECQAGFTRVDHLHRHLKTQSSHFHTVQNEKQYHPCPHCSKLFTRRDHMKRHIKIHIRGEPVKCVECQTWFPSKMDLTHHLLEAHHVLVFECNACSKGFFEAKYLTEHLRNKHDMIDGADGRMMRSPTSKLPPSPHALQLPFRCGICSLSFINELACNKHMVSHTKGIVSPVALTPGHLTEVRDAAALSQLWAQAPSLSQEDKGNNLAMQGAFSPPDHSKGNPYFGNGMGVPAFPQNDCLSPHVKCEPGDGNHDSRREKAGKGEEFSAVNGHFANLLLKGAFPTPDMALRMMQCPGGNDSLMCGVCGKGFTRPQELKLHLRRHSGHHRFVCLECGACFASSSNLVRHQRTHSGEKPFKCSLCTAAFTHKGALINHERIHTGERPYVCDLCEAAFARVDALTRHKRTHKENRIKQEEEGGGASPDEVYGVSVSVNT